MKRCIVQCTNLRSLFCTQGDNPRPVDKGGRRTHQSLFELVDSCCAQCAIYQSERKRGRGMSGRGMSGRGSK